MNHRFCSAILVILIVFTVAGCSTGNIEKIVISEMESFSTVKTDSNVEITDRDTIKMFAKAFAAAKKEMGVVDMVDPQYQVELDRKTYYLWIGEDSGTIMNTEDTHTVYTLSKSAAGDIYEVVQNLFND